jgi:hypothetical protein
MALFIDDIIMLPGTIGKIVLNTLAQTAHKVAWAEYSRDLKKLLLQARHDYDEKKITSEQFKEVEAMVFREMRMARKIMSGQR